MRRSPAGTCSTSPRPRPRQRSASAPGRSSRGSRVRSSGCGAELGGGGGMTERELRALAAYVDLPEERDLAPAVRARAAWTAGPARVARRRIRSGARRRGSGVRGSAGALGNPSALPPPGGDDRARRRAAAGAPADDARPRHPDRSGRRRAHRRLPAPRVEPARATRRGDLGRRPPLVPVRPRSAARLPGCGQGAERARQEGLRARDDHPRRSTSTASRATFSAACGTSSTSPRTISIREERVRLAEDVLLWQHGPLLMRIEGRFTEAEALRIARSFH